MNGFTVGWSQAKQMEEGRHFFDDSTDTHGVWSSPALGQTKDAGEAAAAVAQMVPRSLIEKMWKEC